MMLLHVALMQSAARGAALLASREVSRRTPGLIRGSRVELKCPGCFVSAVLEEGAPARVEHIGSCSDTPFVQAVLARRQT